MDPGIKFTMNGNTTYTLNVGDEWTEPGYKAVLSSSNQDITNEVFVHGFVSTAYPGTYKLKYVIQSEYGTEYEYTRTVIVLGNDVPETVEVEEPSNSNLGTIIGSIAGSVTFIGGIAIFTIIKRKGGII